MKRFLMGFVYAINGIYKALKEERNLRLHCITGLLLLVLSSFYSFSRVELLLLLVIIGIVVALELVNSSIERSVDKPLERHYYSAGAAKDMAAGAVLVFSIISAICGVMLFWDIKVFKSMLQFAIQRPVIVILTVLAFALAYVWAFKTRKEDK